MALLILATPHNRLPVRVRGDTLENDTEPRVQNDATGYALWITSLLIADGAISPTSYDLDTITQTVRYLDQIQYWQDTDDGHWEEDRRVHVSSIGAVIAGLRTAQDVLVRYQCPQGQALHNTIDTMVAKGWDTMNRILAYGVTDVQSLHDPTDIALQSQAEIPSHDVSEETLAHLFLDNFSVYRRRYDSALLFLVEPLRVFTGVQTHRIVEPIKQHLIRPHGFARYEGDTYWGPRFKDIMPIEERTTAAEGRTEWRNQQAAGIAYSGTEARWTLFDPPVSTISGIQYSESGNPADYGEELYFLNRHLSQYVREGSTLHVPEAYYKTFVPSSREGIPAMRWIPNDHSPLLWTQANALLALQQFVRSCHLLQSVPGRQAEWEQYRLANPNRALA